ncbi:hypothetical protein CSUI_004171 [Cystoisospora suis]|uniref:Transmembrane protein n=1 Tax=Cystoisospora suis TaxID=483139 RepID=A0A2C6L2L4_9APIC|nr:hypothetical protein CSUI_004171 [Cystoisospora suis]
MRKRNDEGGFFFVSPSHVGIWLKKTKKIWIFIFLLLAFMSSVHTPHTGAPQRAKNADVFYSNNRFSFLQLFPSMLVSSFFYSSFFPSSLLRSAKNGPRLLCPSSSLMLFSLLPVLPSSPHIPLGSTTPSSFLVSPSLLLASSLETSGGENLSSSSSVTEPSRSTSNSSSSASRPSSSSFIHHLHSSLYLLKPFSDNFSGAFQGSQGRARSLLRQSFLLPLQHSVPRVNFSSSPSSSLLRNLHSDQNHHLTPSSLSFSSLSSPVAKHPLSSSGRAVTPRSPSSASFSFAASQEVSTKEKEKEEEEERGEQEPRTPLEKDKTEEEEKRNRGDLSSGTSEEQQGPREEGVNVSFPKKQKDLSTKLLDYY